MTDSVEPFTNPGQGRSPEGFVLAMSVAHEAATDGATTDETTGDTTPEIEDEAGFEAPADRTEPVTVEVASVVDTTVEQTELEPVPPLPAVATSPTGGVAVFTAPATVVAGRRPARRWPWITAIAVLIVALSATGFVAFHEHRSAQDWKASATTWKSRATKLTAKSTQQGATINDQQDRLTTLAAEKSQVEDEREKQKKIADAVAKFAVLYRDAGAKLQTCIQTWQRFANDLINNMYGSLDLSGEAANTDQICNDASNAYNSTENLLQQIQNS